MKDTEIKDKNTPPVVWTSIGGKVPLSMKAEFMMLADKEGLAVNQYVALLVKHIVEGKLSLQKLLESDQLKIDNKKIAGEVLSLTQKLTSASKETNTLKSENKALTLQLEEKQGSALKINNIANDRLQLIAKGKKENIELTASLEKANSIIETLEKNKKEAVNSIGNLQEEIKKLKARIEKANAYIIDQEERKLFSGKPAQF